MFVGMIRIFFLKVTAVRQKDRAEVARGGRAVDFSGKALFDQERQVPAVIQMRMGQDDRVNFGRTDRKRFPVPKAQLLETLEQTAVHQHIFGTRGDQIFGPGHRARGAQKSDFHSVTQHVKAWICSGKIIS